MCDNLYDLFVEETSDKETGEVDNNYFPIWKAERLFQMACAGDIDGMEKYYADGGTKGIRYKKFGIEHSLIMGAFRNNQFDMVKVLKCKGETLTEAEQVEINTEMQRISMIRLLATN